MSASLHQAARSRVPEIGLEQWTTEVKTSLLSDAETLCVKRSECEGVWLEYKKVLITLP